MKRQNSGVLTVAPASHIEAGGHSFVQRLFGALLILLLFCSAVPAPALAAIAYVQQNGSVSNNSAFPVTSVNVSITSAPAVGNTIIVSVAMDRSSGTASLTCSDNMSNAYTTDVIREHNSAPNYVSVAICSAQIAAGKVPTTVTLTHHSAYNRVVQIHEFSGIATAPAIDKTSSGSGSSTTPSSGVTAATAQADEMLFGAVAVGGTTADSFTADGSFTGGPFRLSQNSGSYPRTLNTQYRIVSAVGTYAYAPTLGTSRLWADVIVTYKGAVNLCPGGVVTTTADTGTGSLRECINSANSSPGTTISFNIPGPGNQSSGGDSWWRISPASALPTITANGTIIDGTTQTTNQGNTNSLGPEIELNGTGAGVVNGLWVTSANNTIKGLIINGYNGAAMAGIRIDGAGATGNIVAGNYIGTNYSGTTAVSNKDGVYILGGAQGNTIGGSSGSSTRNIISGNSQIGVTISGSGTNLNIVIGNYIGTNPSGSGAVANTQFGVWLTSSAANNDIGGQNAGEGNVISGNGSNGITVGSNGNRIRGNRIGTNAAGTAKVANTGDGIKVNDTDGLTIGGSVAGAGNIISGNGGDGIDLIDWTRNVDIYGNTIGSGVTATETTLGNTGSGLIINSFYAPSNYNIGGTASGQGNVIANNVNRGIYFQSGTAAVLGNYIGTNSGGASLPNSGEGIYVTGGTMDIGNAAESQSNIIGPNFGAGINLTGGTTNLAGTVIVKGSVTFSAGILSMGSATLNVSGNWTRTAATITPGTSTVNLNGTSNQTITSGGASFFNLTLNNTGASGSDKVSIVGALDINGALTITDGVLNISTTAPANNATVNTAGNVTIAAAGSVDVTSRTANWTFDGTSILTDASSGGPQQLNNVVLNGTSLTLGSSAKMKSFTNSLGTMYLGASGYILELTSTGTPLSNSGTFTPGTSTVKYTGTTTATNVATVPYSSLWLAPSAATTYSLTGHLTSGNAMTGNLTVDTNATLDVVSGSNYNVTTVNVMLNGTYLARVSTINVGGNWDMTNGTFTRGTSTVNFTGTGAIINNVASWWVKSFYNLTAAAAGNTTTFDTASGGVNIVNVLTLGTGVLSGGQALLSKDSGTPLITAGATLSNTSFKYDGATGPVNVAATTYPELWIAGNGAVNTFNLAGNITCGNLFIYGNGSGNLAVLDTTINNYSINCNQLSVGTNAVTTYGTLTLNNSTVNINGNATIYASDAGGTNQINAGGSTLNVSGSWTNNDTFTAGTSTVVLNGTNQTISGNTIFNNLTKSTAIARTLTFVAGSTTTINGIATLNGASGQLLSLVSSSPATQWNLNMGAASTKAISFVNVSDSNASGSDASKRPILPTSSTDGGNNIAWFGFVISGTVYTDEATTLIGDGAVIRLLVNGTSQGTHTTASGTGTYSITAASLNSGDALLVYIDGHASKGSTATVSNGASLSGLNIYGGHVITRHDNAGALSNLNMKNAKGAYVDSDIEYSADGSNNLTVSGSAVLYVPASHSYTPAASVVTPAMKSVGTFNGGGGTIDVNGALVITGGSFTATSGTTFVGGNLTISSGSFIHNSGSITLDSSSKTINTGVAALNNLTLTSGIDFTVSSTVTVAGNLTITDVNVMSGGTLAVAGDVTTTDTATSTPMDTVILLNGTGVQTLAAAGGTGLLPSVTINKGSGTLTLQDTMRLVGYSNWTYTAGAVNAGSSTVGFYGGHTITSGAMSFNHVEFNSDGDITVADTLTVGGNFTISKVNALPGGNTIAVAGNVVTTDVSTGTPMDDTILLNGTGAQILGAAGGTGRLPGVLINKPSGLLTIQDTLNIYNGWNYTAGTVDASTSTVGFIAQSQTISSGAMAFNNIFFNTGGDITVIGVMDVNGNLTLTATNQLTGTEITVAGNLTSADASNGGDTIAITLDGTGAQTITQTTSTGRFPRGTFTINKASGVATLASNITLNGPGQDLTIASGTLSLSGYNLVLTGAGDILTVGANGTLQLQGAETVTATTKTLSSGSTVIYNGAASYASLTLGNNYHHLTFNGSGNWTHGGALNVAGNLAIASGTLISNGQNINLSGNWSNSGAYTSGANTVTLTGSNQIVSGSSVFNNLTKNGVGSDTLTFVNGTTQTVNGTLTLAGSSGNVLNLRSSSPGSQWYLNLSGGSAVSHVDVDDSNALGGNAIYAYYSSDDTPPSNNDNWIFENLQLVKQVWNSDGTLCLASIPMDASCNGGATTIVVPSSSVVTFLIFIRNLISTTVSDVRFQDLLDDGEFVYQASTLYRSANDASAPGDNATLSAIMAATSIPQTDAYDGDVQVNDFCGIDTVASPDNLQVGGAGGVGQNDILSLPANRTFAVKFKALKN